MVFVSDRRSSVARLVDSACSTRSSGGGRAVGFLSAVNVEVERIGTVAEAQGLPRRELATAAADRNVGMSFVFVTRFPAVDSSALWADRANLSCLAILVDGSGSWAGQLLKLEFVFRGHESA